MEKLAISCWNFKGGVGKSVISLVLSEIAAQKGLRVLAIDTDEQKNLSSALSFIADKFPNLQVKDSLASDDAEQDYELFIVDCRPEMSDTVKKAIHFADIILVPVMADLFSAANVGAVWQFIQGLDKNRQQAAMVKNCFDSTVTTREIDGVLQDQSLPMAGRLPRNANLVRNIVSGRIWSAGMDARQQNPFLHLYSHVWSAYKKMLTDGFDHPWR